MSGHSKWSTIKHKKAATDARRGKLFSKISRRSPSPPAWAAAIPRATRACAPPSSRRGPTASPATTSTAPSRRAPASSSGESYEEITYEGYGPGGVAILGRGADRQPQPHRRRDPPRCSTARRQPRRGGLRRLDVPPPRLLRHRPGRHGRGEVHGARPRARAPTTSRSRRTSTRSTATMRGLPRHPGGARAPGHARWPPSELAMIPPDHIDAPRRQGHQVLRLVEALEDQDDVQKVWANLNIDDKVLEAAVPLARRADPRHRSGQPPHRLRPGREARLRAPPRRRRPLLLPARPRPAAAAGPSRRLPRGAARPPAGRTWPCSRPRSTA